MKLDCRVAAAGDMDSVYELRHTVFVVEQGVPQELERDEADGGAVHVVAVAPGGLVVGTGRLLAPQGPDGAAHLGRIAVAGAWRGRGVGRALMAELEAQAVARYGVGGAVRVELAAQLTAAGFYEHLGYQLVGPVYLDAGIEHRDAWKLLTTPG